MANAAIYDRVTIMPTSRAPAATAGNMAAPTFQRPPQPIDDNDEPINVAMPPPPQANPVVGQFPGMPPQPQATRDAAADAARSAPGAADVAAPRRGRAAADSRTSSRTRTSRIPPARHAADDRTRWWSGRA